MTIKRPVLDPNALYGASQVAAILKVSRGTVYRYLKGHIRKANGRQGVYWPRNYGFMGRFSVARTWRNRQE